MKTPIQILLENLEQDYSEAHYEMEKSVIRCCIGYAEEALETEKQQIIDFANKCQLVRDVDMDGNITFVNPAEFFESTYSTKKL